MIAQQLQHWDNFYVITGSAAAGLTGLTFVVIALASNAGRVNGSGLRAFITPIIVHFGSVLALSAFMTVPGLTPRVLSVVLALGGLAGMVYAMGIARGLRRNGHLYRADAGDWCWNAALPFATHGWLFVSACALRSHPEQALYTTAVVAMILLFDGIHNAWDLAVWMTLRGQRVKDKGPDEEAPKA